MFETFGFDSLSPQSASLFFGLALGTLFGLLAERSRFCLRRGLVGPSDERREALALWAVALATAVAGTQGAVAAGWIAFEDHRLLARDMPVFALVAGGLLFGAGMVLARGCPARLTVLAGTGNLRALVALVLFGIVAQATMTGALSSLRTTLGTWTLPAGDAASLSALPGGAAFAAPLLVLAAACVAVNRGIGLRGIATGVAIGLLVPAGWVGTGLVLFDEFDPIAHESLAFTAPHAETLFWMIASTSIAPGFGLGLVVGTLAGAFLAAAHGRRLRLQGFDASAPTGRYALGAGMMGVGGVLAGGCTLGAGLSGIPTLSVAALLALCAIVAGAIVTDRAISASPSGSAAPSARHPAQPAR